MTSKALFVLLQQNGAR